MESDKVTYHLPERPYSIVDSLNRRAAAVGSVPVGMAAARANYNGHFVRLYWNDYRQYYVADYTWAGRVVVGRGSFENCLRAVLSEYNRGALGASASVHPREDDAEAIALCEATPELVSGEEAWPPPWHTWRHSTAAGCARDYASRGSTAMQFDLELLEAAENEEAYCEALRVKYGRVYV
jgi:hypothetical protein